jgi:hypothetical protein
MIEERSSLNDEEKDILDKDVLFFGVVMVSLYKYEKWFHEFLFCFITVSSRTRIGM